MKTKQKVGNYRNGPDLVQGFQWKWRAKPSASVMASCSMVLTGIGISNEMVVKSKMVVKNKICLNK